MIFCIFGGGKCRPRWGVQRGLPLALLGNFQRCLQCGSENSLISYGIFPVNTLRRAVRLPFGGGCPCRLLPRITPPYFSLPVGGWRGNHFRLQRQSKHGALCRLKGQAAAPFPDKSSSRFAASVFIGKTLYPTAPCLLCLCKRK